MEERANPGPGDTDEERALPRSPDIRNLVADRVRLGTRAVRGYTPGRQTLQRDVLAGLTGAIGSVPDGMASGVLAGVNPVYGLYASLVGPIAGGLLASTQLLVVVTTSAAAIAAGQEVGRWEGAEREQALFLLVLLIGAIQIAAGLLRLGSLTRFVSHSVMVGFLTGVAVLIVLGQLGTFVGYEAPGANKVMQALNLLLSIRQVNPLAIATGTLALLLAATLPRTRLGAFGVLVALAVPSLLVALLGWDSVQLVQDTGEIPRGVPLPSLPSLSLLTPDLITAAFAIAAVILVQGAGVAQSVPNADGRPSDASRDFTAQGVANVVSGLFRGLPVGGSVGQTALNVTAGAQTRWAAIFSGVWMLLILVLFAGLVGQVPMPALAALLILAGLNTIRVDEALSIWQTGWAPRLGVLVTFLATLFLPIQAAIGLGALLSTLLHIYAASGDVALVELVTLPDGRVEARPAPETLPGEAVTVLEVYGSVFYAGAWTLERMLPSAQGAQRPVVVLRLRGRTQVGATFVDLVDRYADQLGGAGGRLYLTGIDPRVREQLHRSGKVEAGGPLVIYEARAIVGDSSRQAAADARAWLAGPRQTVERREPPQQPAVTPDPA
jgi:sulfate permease, SulP family